MSTVLYIQSSPRGAESFSIRAADALVAEVLSARPACTIERLDLFAVDLPPFSAPAARAKYAILGGQEPTDDAGRAWKEVIEVADHFKAADAYVVASGMWNFGIPYRLKHYVDLLVQPGLTFRYSPESGYEGLVTGKPAALVLARGGSYGEGSGMADSDYQRTYLEAVLGFIGFTDVETIVVEPTILAGPDTAGQALDRAGERARAVGRELAVKL